MYTEGQTRDYENAKKAANALGGEFWPFNQSVFLNGQVLGQDGVCSALTTVFMHRINSGAGSFTTYVNSSAGREQVMALWAMQQSGSNQWTSQYLIEVGLKLRYERAGEPLENIISLTKINGYYKVGISDLSGDFSSNLNYTGVSIKAHALCVINDGNKHYAFDPNVGAGIFTNAAAASMMLSKIWRKMYKKYMGATLLSRYS